MTRRTTAVLAAVLALLLVPAVALAAVHLQTPTAPAAAPAPFPTRAPPSSSSGQVPQVEVEGEPADAAEPTAVRVPSIDVDSGLDSLATGADGRLRSPREWQRAGWFAAGAVPGEVGPAVVAGHVDSPTGPAVFADLDRLRAGDLVEVPRADGSVARFEVDRAESYAKGDFPTEAVYGPTPDAQLRLITCDGPYVRSSGGYQDNLVVFATLVDGSAR